MRHEASTADVVRDSIEISALLGNLREPGVGGVDRIAAVMGRAIGARETRTNPAHCGGLCYDCAVLV